MSGSVGGAVCYTKGVIKPCEVCGVEMECVRSTKNTCSSACRAALSKMNNGVIRPPKRALPVGTKWCPKCETAQPLDNFYMSSAGRYFSYCKPCKQVAQNEWKRTSRGLPPDTELLSGTRAAVGTTRVDSAGYVLEKVGTCKSDHPRADKNGWVYQHILVMERELGTPVSRDFTIHHRNADRSDNRPENLELRVGPHGKGGDVIPALLATPTHRDEAVRVLVGMGYTVTPPPTSQYTGKV